MSSYYEQTEEVAVLRERIAELARIREGFATHLGSSLYEATKDNEDLRWGRESLYDGIALCDQERARLVERIAKLNARRQEGDDAMADETETAVAEPVVPETPVVEPGVPVPDVVEPIASETADAERPAPESDAVAESLDVAIEEAPGPFSLDDIWDVPEQTVIPASGSEPSAEPEPEPEPESVPEEPEPEPEPKPEPESAPEPMPAPEPAPVYGPMDTSAPQEDAPVCPKCGAVGRPGNRFCMECGSPLGAASPSGQDEPARPQKPAVCPECGSPVDPTFKFCMTCGHRL